MIHAHTSRKFAYVETIIREICRQESIACQTVQVLQGGQVNAVYRIDDAYVLRIGARENAWQRLQHETALLQSLAADMPVPRVYAFGQQDGFVYQIQQYIAGQSLFSQWKTLPTQVQEKLVAELATYLKILHNRTCPYFGQGHEDTPAYASWADLLVAKFQQTVDELAALQIRMMPGFLELAVSYFEEHKHLLQAGVPVLTHGDLTLANILVDEGKISALLDFEYSLQAPKDYELGVIEAFCLYPNDWAAEGNEIYCTTDFASFIQLLRKEYPELFEIPHLRERVNLYHLTGNLSSYLAWRKDNLSTIPPEQMAAKGFYMAHITNFSSDKGIKMF